MNWTASFNPNLLAASESSAEAVYEFSRLEALHDSPWLVAGLIAIVLGVLLYVWLFYRREARTISHPKAIVLALLRSIAVLGLAVFFLGLEKRSSRMEKVPSRVVVMCDKSLSMNLPSQTTRRQGEGSRHQDALNLIASSPLLEELAKSHDVELVAFSEAVESIGQRRQQSTDDAIIRENDNATKDDTDASSASDSFDASRLAKLLDPSGRETRFGDSLAETLQRYRGLPLAAVIVLTDGGQNMGLEPLAVVPSAKDAKVMLHTVGYGPLKAPANVAVRELIAPERAYPGDALTMQAVIQSSGLSGQKLEAQLLKRPSGNADAKWELIDSTDAIVAADDDLQTLSFKTVPDVPGKFDFELRVAERPTEAQTDDNAAQAEVAVVERKTSVLLFAGGPTRDYRYLRNQLYRDKSFTVDVLLQSAVEGISQDADKILFEFPKNLEELSKYDALVAFDPDWTALASEELRYLESWVSNQAGGLVVIPGVVNTSQWGADSRMRTLRGLYPIRFASRMMDLRRDLNARDKPQSLRFTREGNEAQFLWLADVADQSEESWLKFDGVFGAIDHLGPKPGATTYATVADDQGTEEGPAYLVGQFYGAGQVFAMGSGETWRLRAVDPNHFDRFWTQLLRHVSNGRLLQGSPRGKLLVSQDRYEVGATVALRAVISDKQLQPLNEPVLPLVVELPGGEKQKLELKLDPKRPGNYAAEMRAIVPGAHRFELLIPDSDDALTRVIRVSVPQLEIKQTVRNEAELRSIANLTGGNYYASSELALRGGDGLASLVEATPSQARTRQVVGKIDRDFAIQQAYTLLAVIAGALSLEWIFRRLQYLA